MTTFRSPQIAFLSGFRQIWSSYGIQIMVCTNSYSIWVSYSGHQGAQVGSEETCIWHLQQQAFHICDRFHICNRLATVKCVNGYKYENFHNLKRITSFTVNEREHFRLSLKHQLYNCMYAWFLLLPNRSFIFIYLFFFFFFFFFWWGGVV